MDGSVLLANASKQLFIERSTSNEWVDVSLLWRMVVPLLLLPCSRGLFFLAFLPVVLPSEPFKEGGESAH
jgi:hypothetical protein